jgi:ankyrin repeat protein
VGIAAYRGNLNILDMLYRAGADINLTSKHGAGPLYLAIKQDQIEIMKYLVERNAFTHIYDPTQSEYSPLYQSIRLGNF